MSAETPADVIEAAAKVLDTYLRGSVLQGGGRILADGLHAAGLLADPADRDELELVREEKIGYRLDALDALRRAERAEAEVAGLRATVQRCKALADEWERIDSTPAQWATARLRAALDSEGGK